MKDQAKLCWTWQLIYCFIDFYPEKDTTVTHLLLFLIYFVLFLNVLTPLYYPTEFNFYGSPDLVGVWKITYSFQFQPTKGEDINEFDPRDIPYSKLPFCKSIVLNQGWLYLPGNIALSGDIFGCHKQ